MDVKAAVRAYWDREPCGTRYALGDDPHKAHAMERHRLEPHIADFARFASAAGKDILEIGVGRGADFIEWVEHAKHATGVDLTASAIRETSDRLVGSDPSRFTLRVADAEALPFPDRTFDLVYSYGVLHHTPDTARAFQEAARVLRPGGRLKAMIYQPYCWSGLMIWGLHGLAKGHPRMTIRQAIFDNLESPGTKAYTPKEARALLTQAGLEPLSIISRLNGSDLLLIKPSSKYRRFELVFSLFPRWIVRLLGHKFGLHLLVEAQKPLTAA